MGFLAAAAPIIAAGASLIQGIGGLVSGLHNQKVYNAQAGEELSAGAEQERQLQMDARGSIGTQLAAQWGNGLEGGTGTALDALRESELNALLDAREIRRQASSRAASLRAKGSQAATEGAFSLASGMIGAASTYGSMTHDWAQARTGSTPVGST